MINKKIVAAAVSFALAPMAYAGSFQTVTSEAVGTEASTSGTYKANIAGDSIVMTVGADSAAGNRIYLTLTNGATFADAGYTLEESAGGAGTGDLTHFTLITPNPAGQSELQFRISASDASVGDEFILSGSSIAGQAININTPAKSAGETISLQGRAVDVIGTYDNYSPLELFEYANEFSASLELKADATIDVDQDRLKFTGPSDTDVIGLEFTRSGVTNRLALNDTDTVDIALSGDMSGIESITVSTQGVDRGTMTIDQANDMASFSASASDVFLAGTGSASTLLTAKVWGSATLSTRTFTLQTDLDFESETDKNVIAAQTNAGAWDINGIQAKVSHMSLNASGFVSWLKVVNEGNSSADIIGDIIWTLADGTDGKMENVNMGSVDAGGITTVSEATILTAMGSPTQLADVHITLTVTGQVDKIHLTAEKKAADGRTTIPVYYNREGGNKRSWVQ